MESALKRKVKKNPTQKPKTTANEMVVGRTQKKKKKKTKRKKEGKEKNYFDVF